MGRGLGKDSSPCREEKEARRLGGLAKKKRGLTDEGKGSVS